MHGVMDVRGSKPRGVASVPGRAVSRSGTGAVVERKREEGKAKEGEERGERRERRDGVHDERADSRSKAKDDGGRSAVRTWSPGSQQKSSSPSTSFSLEHKHALRGPSTNAEHTATTSHSSVHWRARRPRVCPSCIPTSRLPRPPPDAQHPPHEMHPASRHAPHPESISPFESKRPRVRCRNVFVTNLTSHCPNRHSQGQLGHSDPTCVILSHVASCTPPCPLSSRPPTNTFSIRYNRDH